MGWPSTFPIPQAQARSGCDGDWRPLATDKPTYEERFGENFENTRAATLDWLKTQNWW